MTPRQIARLQDSIKLQERTLANLKAMKIENQETIKLTEKILAMLRAKLNA